MIVTRSRIIAINAEAPEADEAGFAYEFDFQLRPLSVRPDSRIADRLAKLQREGKLKRTYSLDGELLQLRNSVHRASCTS